MELLQHLRAATAAHHEALHVHPALCRLTDNSVTRAYHQGALRRFYGFYCSMELRYAASAVFLLDEFPAGSVLVWLGNDLAHGDLAVDSLDLLMGPQAPLTLEQALGYLYVREGSALGGKVISMNLERVLALEPGKDNQFFWAHGVDTGRRWKSFLTHLDALQGRVNGTEVANFAALLFRNLKFWLDQKDVVNV